MSYSKEGIVFSFMKAASYDELSHKYDGIWVKFPLLRHVALKYLGGLVMKRSSRNPYVERMHVVVTSRSEGIQIQVTNLAGQIAVQFISWDEFFADPSLKEGKKND